MFCSASVLLNVGLKQLNPARLVVISCLNKTAKKKNLLSQFERYVPVPSAGGLFGSSTFSQPATSSTSTGFGFGAATGTSTGLFGSTGTGTSSGLFSQQNNAFGAKPTSFGSEYPVVWIGF